MSDYNGWKNYETWRVNLEIFDGMDPKEYGWSRLDEFDLADILKDYAEEIISTDAKEGLALSYALAFIQDVDWREIARGMLEAYSDDEDEEETEEA